MTSTMRDRAHAITTVSCFALGMLAVAVLAQLMLNAQLDDVFRAVVDRREPPDPMGADVQAN